MKKFVLGVAVVLGLILVLQWVRLDSLDPTRAVRGMRIISLAPNLTGLLFDLGVGGHVVAVTTYCDYPPEALKREKIGDFINPNFEKIVRLKPDLVFAEEWSSSKTVPRLKQLGVHVEEVPTPRSLHEIYRLIERVGDLTGQSLEAEVLIQNMQERVAKIEARARRFPTHPRLYLEIDRPSWTVGGSSFTNQAIELCGARNIFSDLARPAPQVSEEAIIERNPDIIISFASSTAEIRRRGGWNRIGAVQSGRIIDDFNPDLLSRGNHRLVEGMEALQTRIELLMGFGRE
ncbi:MAG: ABC transporter substrate-binding protein [Acidobacteriota bacterium]